MDEFTRQVGKDLRALLKEANAIVENMQDELSREGEIAKKKLLERDMYFIEDPQMVLMLYEHFDELSRLRRRPLLIERIRDGIGNAYRTLKQVV